MDGSDAGQTGSQQDSNGTGDNNDTAATQNNKNREAATEKPVEKSTEPKPKQLTPEEIANRDRLNEEKRQKNDLQDRFDRLENAVVDNMVRADAQKFLDENVEAYPDVEIDDLLSAQNPEQFAELAKQTQGRIEKATQRKLQNIEKTTNPVLTPEQKAQRDKELMSKPGVQSLEAHIAMQGKS